MATLKEDIQEALAKLPDDVTWQEFVEAVRRRREDEDAITEQLNRVYDHADQTPDPVFQKLQLTAWPREEW